MLHTLLILAAIPFAIAGLVLVASLAWMLPPYLLLLSSGAIAALIYQGPHSDYAVIPALVALASLAWISNRWSGPVRRALPRPTTPTEPLAPG